MTAEVLGPRHTEVIPAPGFSLGPMWAFGGMNLWIHDLSLSVSPSKKHHTDRVSERSSLSDRSRACQVWKQERGAMQQLSPPSSLVPMLHSWTTWGSDCQPGDWEMPLASLASLPNVPTHPASQVDGASKGSTWPARCGILGPGHQAPASVLWTRGMQGLRVDVQPELAHCKCPDRQAPSLRGPLR